MARAEIIVVGSGIAGASIAAELAAEANVVLIEAEDAAGYHTTGRSAAMYLPSYGNEAIRALTRASRDFLRSPPLGFAGHPLLHRRGLLTVADTEHVAALDAPLFHDHYRLSPDAALMLVPALRRDAIAGARYDWEAWDIDVDLLHQAYLRMARTNGARILFGHRVAGATRSQGQWQVSCTGGQTLCADFVVNAAGAWGDEIAATFGAGPAGLSARRRTMILVDPPAEFAVEKWPFVMTVQESVYFRPESGKLAISPADETEDVPSDVQPEELDVAIGIDRFQQLDDMPVSKVSHSWAGLRTFTPDRTPVVGFDPAVPGFFWFAGQGGYGIQIAPATAAMGAALLLDRPLPQSVLDEGITPDMLSPARFRQECLV
jgi:D-arginine dehydrogenase